MNERKKILILGNGFDLAHFLPTKYEHFITAMSAVEEAPVNEPLLFDNIFHKLLVDKDFFLERTKKIYKTEEVKILVEDLMILKEKLSNNGWFQYFKDYLDSGIDTWIDFENEIKNVLDIVCSVLDKNSEKNEIVDMQYSRNDLNIIDIDFFKRFNTNRTYYLNVLIKLNLLREIYVFESEEGFIEVSEDKFNNINFECDYDPITGLGRTSPTFESLTLNNNYIKRYKGEITGINIYKVIKNLSDYLLDFVNIFSAYIKLIETLVPRVELKKPKVLSGLDYIYSFNYSSTIENFYINRRVNFLHGRVRENNLVLGISDIENPLLINEKAYGFVKYYQKLVNNTDYKFLLGNSDLIKLEQAEFGVTTFTAKEPFEIYIWGHSLDSSDSDYIKEIFSFNKGKGVAINLIIYYFLSPHAQLANLISIMGKDVIEKWMKKGWLEFVEAPDIYALNNTEDYVDKLSKYSEKEMFK